MYRCKKTEPCSRNVSWCLLWLFLIFTPSLVLSSGQAYAQFVTLAWNPNTDAVGGYRIYLRNGDPDVEDSYDYNSPLWQGWILADYLSLNDVVNGNDGFDHEFSCSDSECTVKVEVEDDIPWCFVVRAFDEKDFDIESGDSNSDCLNSSPKPDPGPNQTLNEGETVYFSGSFTDPDTDDIHTITWDFGDGETAYDTLTPNHTYADNGTYTVGLTVEDNHGNEASDTLVVTVNNVPPTVDAGQNQSIYEGGTVYFSGGFSDPGTDDTHTITWDFGDGVTTYGKLDPTHTYVASGTYSVMLTVEDIDGGRGSDALYVVVASGEDPESPPVQPNPAYPSYDNEVVTLPLSLATGTFADPDGDPHVHTEWQISEEDPYFSDESLVFYLETGNYLESVQIPALVLKEGPNYYWRVCFKDPTLMSLWSTPVQFTAETTYEDIDPENGVPDDQEVEPFSDLDNNGVPDLYQSDMKSVASVVGDVEIGVKAGANVLSIEALKSMDNATLPITGQTPDEMPFGLFAFRALATPPGVEGEVTVYFSDPVPDGARWYKYDSVNGWEDENLNISYDRMSVTLSIKDGGHGDADGVANGIIVDPGGVGITYDSTPSPDPGTSGDATSGGGSGGGGGGCFLSGTVPSGLVTGAVWPRFVTLCSRLLVIMSLFLAIVWVRRRSM